MMRLSWPQAMLRRLISSALAIGLLVVMATHDAAMQAPGDNPIVLENQQPGSGDWVWSKLARRCDRADQRIRIGDQRQPEREHHVPRHRQPGADLHDRLLPHRLVRRGRAPAFAFMSARWPAFSSRLPAGPDTRA